MASNGVPVPGVCGSYERLLAPVGLSGVSMFQSVSAEPGAALWVAFFCGELGPEAFVGLPCTGRQVTTAYGGSPGPTPGLVGWVRRASAIDTKCLEWRL